MINEVLMQKMYNKLSDKYEAGSYEKFKEYITSSDANAKKIFDKLSKAYNNAGEFYDFKKKLGLNTPEDDSLSSRQANLSTIRKSPLYPEDMREKAEYLAARDTVPSLAPPDSLKSKFEKTMINKKNIDEEPFNMTEYWKDLPNTLAEGLSGGLSEAANAGLYGISKMSNNEKGEFNLPFGYKYYARQPSFEDFKNAITGRNYDKNLLQEVISDPVTYMPSGIVEASLAKVASKAPAIVKGVVNKTPAIVKGGLSSALQGVETASLEAALNNAPSEDFGSNAYLIGGSTALGKLLGRAGKGMLASDLGIDVSDVNKFQKFEDIDNSSPASNIIPFMNKGSVISSSPIRTLKNIQKKLNAYGDKYSTVVDDLSKLSSMDLDLNKILNTIENKVRLKAKATGNPKDAEDIIKFINVERDNTSKYLSSKVTDEDIKASSGLDRTILERRKPTEKLAENPNDMPFGKVFNERKRADRLADFAKKSNKGNKADLKRQFYRDYRSGIEGSITKKLGEGEVFSDLLSKFPELKNSNVITEDIDTYIKSLNISDELETKVRGAIVKPLDKNTGTSVVFKQTSPRKKEYGSLKDKFSQSAPFKEALEKKYSKPTSESSTLFQFLSPNRYTIASQLYKSPQRVKEVTPFMLNIGDEGDETPENYILIE